VNENIQQHSLTHSIFQYVRKSEKGRERAKTVVGVVAVAVLYVRVALLEIFRV
jgi:hypothetical protein